MRTSQWIAARSEKRLHGLFEVEKSKQKRGIMSSILPRVNTGYKRVDADDPRHGTRVRFGWKKFAVAAAVIIGLVWLFGPRERRESVIGTITTPCASS